MCYLDGFVSTQGTIDQLPDETAVFNYSLDHPSNTVLYRILWLYISVGTFFLRVGGGGLT